MNLGIIGCGAIGTDVSLAADGMKEIEKIYLQDIDKKKAVNLKKNLKKAEIKPVKEFLEKCRRCIRSCVTASSR
jgi:predicted dinucleotide-utilizing enzyme